MKYFLQAFRKYADFKGRARRKEFWYFVLISGLVQSLFVGFHGSIYGHEKLFDSVASAIFFIPTLAVAVRRLHDIGRSGWWIVIAPTGIGTVVLFVMMLIEGDRGLNEYGPDPKAIGPSKLDDDLYV